jgi:DNA-binding NarL/FixJ family response regulator
VPDKRLRVLLAEDDPAMRQRLCDLLGKEHDVVGAVDDGQTILDCAGELKPDMILLDISMPGLNGFAVAQALRKLLPQVPILFVTQHTQPLYLEEALRAGASGYVLKRHVVRELSTALQQVHSGRPYVSPSLQSA